MSHRVNLVQESPENFGALNALSRDADEHARRSGVDAKLLELVRIRASQLNGCRFCVAMHTRSAREAGESEHRLRELENWPDSSLFTESEQAALRLTESVTLLNDRKVPDEDYRPAEKHFDEPQLASLLWTVALINAYNRLSIATASVS
ncbi:carboxymuconolactone decarboxylase family protein [Saccharopolyspora sp. NPDC000995]